MRRRTMLAPILPSPTIPSCIVDSPPVVLKAWLARKSRRTRGNAPPLRRTAASRVSLPARQSTSGCQKSVRPTAKPTNPGTAAAVASHSCTFWSFSPRPRMMQLTLPRPPRRAAATIFSQSSRRSRPSIFHRSGSTPAFCSSSIARTISLGRSSRSYAFLSPLSPSSCAGSGGTRSSNINRLVPLACR